MEHVEAFLKHIGLGQYAQVFEENAYDSLDMFFVMDETDFKIFGPYVGMKPGHLLRLQKTVFRMKNKCASQAREMVSSMRHGAVPIIDLAFGNDEGEAESVAAVNGAAVNGSATATTVDENTIDEVWQGLKKIIIIT